MAVTITVVPDLCGIHNAGNSIRSDNGTAFAFSPLPIAGNSTGSSLKDSQGLASVPSGHAHYIINGSIADADLIVEPFPAADSTLNDFAYIVVGQPLKLHHY